MLNNQPCFSMQQGSPSRMEEEHQQVIQSYQGYCPIQTSCQCSSLRQQQILIPEQHLMSTNFQSLSQKNIEQNACKLYSSMLTNSQKDAFKSAITKLQLKVQRNSLNPTCNETIRLLNKLALIIRSRSDWISSEQFTQSIDNCLDVFLLDCELMQLYEQYLQQKVTRQTRRKQEYQDITSSASRTMQELKYTNKRNNTNTVMMCHNSNMYSNRTSRNFKNSQKSQTIGYQEGQESWENQENPTQYRDNLQFDMHCQQQQLQNNQRDYQQVHSSAISSSIYPIKEAFQQVQNSQCSCIENINPLQQLPSHQSSQPSFIEQPCNIFKKVNMLNPSISSQIESDNFHFNKLIPSAPLQSAQLYNHHNSSIIQSQKSYIEYSMHCENLSAISSIPSSSFKTPENSQTNGIKNHESNISSFLRRLEKINNQEINQTIFTTQQGQKPSQPLMPQSISSRYSYLCQLGSGGYSQVYKYQDIHNKDRFVAVKEISVLQDEVDSKRVLREIYIQKQLQHENVLPILEVHHNKTISNFNTIFLVLDYYPFTLADLIYKYLPVLTWNHDVVHVIMEQLLNGLAYIHSKNVIHRDIKPNNILVDQNLNVKIADFTLATTCMSSHQAQTFIQNNSHFSKHTRQLFLEYKSLNTGSRFYRAPEIILLNPSYDFKVDMWSLGCVLAEVLQTLNQNSLTRGPLFPGQSCYPMSKPDEDPSKGDKGNTKELQRQSPFGPRDQLYLIIKLLGTPEESDCKFIVKESAFKFIQALKFQPHFHYSQLFSSANVSELFLLEKMLQFSPESRVSAEVLLTTQFGMKKQQNNNNLQNIKNNINNNFLDKYDYPFNPIFVDFEIQFHQEGNGLFLNFHHLRRLFIREIHYFQPLDIYPGKLEAYIHDLLQEIQRKRLLQLSGYKIS